MARWYPLGLARKHIHTALFGAEPTPIVFIETGLLLDGQPLQLAFHFRPGDTLPNLPDWPAANGRHWRGQQAQGRALEIAASYLRDRGISI
jgi:hypothetical protein